MKNRGKTQLFLFLSANPFVVWNATPSNKADVKVDGYRNKPSGVLEGKHSVSIQVEPEENKLATIWLDTNDKVRTAHNSYVGNVTKFGKKRTEKQIFKSTEWTQAEAEALIPSNQVKLFAIPNRDIRFYAEWWGRSRCMPSRPEHLHAHCVNWSDWHKIGKEYTSNDGKKDYPYLQLTGNPKGYKIGSVLKTGRKGFTYSPNSKEWEYEARVYKIEYGALIGYETKEPQEIQTDEKTIKYKNNTLSMSGFSEDEAITNLSYNYDRINSSLTVSFISNFTGELSAVEVDGEGSGQFFPITSGGNSLSFPVNDNSIYSLKFRKGRFTTVREITVRTSSEIPIADVEPEPEPVNQSGTYYPAINPAPRNTNTIGASGAAKYRITTPARQGVARYTAVRTLSPYSVQSYIQRGYEVTSVPQDTPLLPMTLIQRGGSVDYAPNSARRGAFVNRIRITDIMPNRRYELAPIPLQRGAGRRSTNRRVIG